MKNLAKIRGILRDKGFEIYTRPYELNIVGFRSRQTKANKFDDEIHVFYKNGSNKWAHHIYKVTTDPGTYWLKNPLYPQGTAILKEGQHRQAYALGKHQGKYLALVQVKSVPVYRDYDRDSDLDFNNRSISVGSGINIHHAASSGKTKYVDKYSAGCQVFENAEEFKEFMQLCKNHEEIYGNVFTYTLIDYRDSRRRTFKRIAAAVSIITTVAIGYFVIREQE